MKYLDSKHCILFGDCNASLTMYMLTHLYQIYTINDPTVKHENIASLDDLFQYFKSLNENTASDDNDYRKENYTDDDQTKDWRCSVRH